MSRTDRSHSRAWRSPPKGVVFDVHGVLLGRTRHQDGTAAGEVVARLRHEGLRLFFVTNSSSSSAADIVRHLRGGGIEARPEEAISAGRAMGLYLREHHHGARLLLIGQPGLRQLIEEAGGSGVRWAEGGEADVVVVGRDPELSMARLEEAAQAGRRGALLLATSDDKHFLSNGALCSGPGGTVRLVEQAMGVRARIVGKPDAFILERGLGLTREQLRAMLIVGDSLGTDVRLGVAVGAATALYGTPTDPCDTGPSPSWRIERLEQLLEIVGLAS